MGVKAKTTVELKLDDSCERKSQNKLYERLLACWSFEESFEPIIHVDKN